MVHLMVGVYADNICEHHDSPVTTPHLERCELVRHCRWVDEVVPEAPWRLDETFLKVRRIDYVAYDEGTSVDPAFDNERLKGYDLVKRLRESFIDRPLLSGGDRQGTGKTIPTQRTTGMAAPMAERSKAQTPIPSRQGTLRGAPSTLKHELLENRKSYAKGTQTSAPLVPELDSPVEQETEEPKVDQFGVGVGV